MRRKRKKYKETDYGEFEFVANKMYSISAIKMAHETPFTKKQTVKLLKCLSQHFFGNKHLLKLKWISKGGWNFGGIDFKYGRKTPFVELFPDKKNKKKRIYGLRAGIVLHEFSHALADYHSRRMSVGEGHGKVFIKTFNKVLRFYHKINANVIGINYW